MKSSQENILDFKALVEHLPEAIAVTQGKGVVRYANAAARELLRAGNRGMEGYALPAPSKTAQPRERKVALLNGHIKKLKLQWSKAKLGSKTCHICILRDTKLRDRESVRKQKLVEELQFALASEKILLKELEGKNEKLLELSTTDELTHLYNRRFIQDRLEFELNRVKRYGGYLTIMMLDVDHFKAVNDTYGHNCGDVVLSGIARVIQDNSREVDICGRYGGEEFLVICNLNLRDAHRYATRLHTKIRESVFAFENRKIRVTASIGVADHRKGMKSATELVERADKMLYEAKHDGRDLIRLWQRKEEPREQPVLDQQGIHDLSAKFKELSSNATSAYMESANALVRAIDAKDHYTAVHSQDVATYSTALARAIGLAEEEVETIRYAALLHDVGKIGIRQEILLKKEALTDEEFAALKTHPVIGAEILKNIKFLEKEIPVVLYHHERCDGTGYPHGLQSNEIPKGAKMMAVADAFDAMTTDREFRKKMTKLDAAKEIQKCCGTQFDKEIGETFVRLVREGGIKSGTVASPQKEQD